MTGMGGSLTVRGLAIVLACVLMIAIGQVLFKAAAGQWRVQGWSWESLRSLLSPALVVALVIYATATVMWVFALRSVPLSVAYPLFALTYVVVPLLAYFAHGEPLTGKAFVGAAIIVLGVAVSVL